MKLPSIRVWTRRLQAASDRVRHISRRVAVWTRETATRRAERADTSEPANPVYLLAAITLGIPTLLAIPLIGMNPGIQEGAFSPVVVFFAVAAFAVAAIFEIKRLADQPSDSEHHLEWGRSRGRGFLKVQAPAVTTGLPQLLLGRLGPAMRAECRQPT